MDRFQIGTRTINNCMIPMMRIDGRMYVTQQTLSKMLGVDADALRHNYRNRREEFGSNCVNSVHAIVFTQLSSSERISTCSD